MKKDEFAHPSQKELLILGILHSVAGLDGIGGLDIVGKSEGKIARGTVYVTLDRMEDKGFVESKKSTELPPGPKRPGAHNFSSYRRLYSITGYGKRVLAAELASRNAFEASFALA